MKTKGLFLIYFFMSIFYTVIGQNIDCPNVYLYAYEIDCPDGPSLGMSVNYPLQSEVDIKLIKLPSNTILEEFSITTEDANYGSSYLHYFGVLPEGDYAVTINSYEYYWGGVLICEQTKQIELLPCGTLNIESFEENLNTTKVYPNPASDIITVKTTTQIKTIEMYNMLGKLLLTTNQSTIKVGAFQKGLYLLKIKTDKGQITKKIIVE